MSLREFNFHCKLRVYRVSFVSSGSLIKVRKFSFWKNVFKVFSENNGSDSVIVLSYTSLLSIVPFLAIIITVFTTTELFQDFSRQILKQLFEHILPASITGVQDYLLQFSQQASKLKGMSLFIAFLTSLILLRTIDSKINSFWPARKPRKWWVSLASYLGITLFGPLFLASSLVVSSYLVAFPIVDGLMHTGDWGVGVEFSFLIFLPFFLNWLGFSFLYRYVPTSKVSWISAKFGGLLAALLIEILKFSFGLYLMWFPTYDLIYGAFAAVPIFLLWMYLSWFVILFNAAVVSQLENTKKSS